MADLTVRRNRGGGGGSIAQNDPFSMVQESMRRMQDLFRDPSFEFDPIGFLESGRMQQFIPDFEVRETQDGLVFLADLPGVKEDDIEITVVGNRLRITGKREFQQENRGDTWYTAERAYGNFTRTFILPEGTNLDNIDANLENGVLVLKVPKQAQAQPRRVALGGGQQQQQQRTIEGQYSQGPFHQSQQKQGQQGVENKQQQGQQGYPSGQQGYQGGQQGYPSGQQGYQGGQQPAQAQNPSTYPQEFASTGSTQAGYGAAASGGEGEKAKAGDVKGDQDRESGRSPKVPEKV